MVRTIKSVTVIHTVNCANTPDLPTSWFAVVVGEPAVTLVIQALLSHLVGVDTEAQRGKERA